MEPPPQALQQPPHGDRVPDMDVHPLPTEDLSIPNPTLWDWENLLDFADDDNFPISFDADDQPLTIPRSSEPEDPNSGPGTDRVRKRDPRMTCSNFLAGRIPCACPEMDEMLKEEEEAGPGKKKRPRTVRSRPGTGTVRCQVRGCKADISELKGYHRRHRVCLRCASASAVLLDGENKRYCQQCGKFHVLSDFDEGKRSCRRKLERHNDRRRRKSSDPEKERQEVLQAEDATAVAACDGEEGKDDLCFSSEKIEKEGLMESEDGQITTLCSDPNSQNINCDSVASFAASGETQINGGKNNPRNSLSPSFCDNKSAYSSVCPTGRISFKLYDWNPAEFPRRLRHQIFEWLANMPIELEGYIRPGCTILTVFIAMPKFMWAKLSEDTMSYVQDFFLKPGRMLSGRGNILVYLNNMIFHVVRDGSSVMEVKLKLRAPRLHYVHPTCFEAGKPMEFVACGSNLLQPKFRFLLSFAGKYLPCDYSVASPCDQNKGDATCNFDHQLCKIYVPHTEPNVFGPAFIEVENETGLSNYIPVLVGDKEICSEMKILQQRVNEHHFSTGTEFAAVGPLSDLCEVSVSRQKAYSELILDIAWLLKEPASENFQHCLTTARIQRSNFLLNFLIRNESTAILKKILQNLKIAVDKVEVESAANDADGRLLQNFMNHATDILHQKLQKGGASVLHSGYSVSTRDHSCSQNDLLSVVPISNQDVETGANAKLGVKVGSTPSNRSETVPLLNREVVMNINPAEEQPNQSCSRVFSRRVLGRRPTIFLIATAATCFGICAVVLHPHRVRQFTVSIRSLLDKIYMLT